MSNTMHTTGVNHHRTTRVGVRLNRDELARLRYLAEERCTNPSQVVRSLILREMRRVESLRKQHGEREERRR